MSDGKKDWAEEREKRAHRAHLERLSKITVSDMAQMHGTLERALSRFTPDTALTWSQHQAIADIKRIRDQLA